MKNYSMSDKYKYFCKKSKVGAIDSNGRLLTDFERGVYMGKALMVQLFAKWDKSRKNNKSHLSNKDNANKGMFTHEYTEEQLNALFDNLKEIR